MTRADLAGQLRDLAQRVRYLAPSHRDPERFHADRSEIEATLRRLSREAGVEAPQQRATAAPQGGGHGAR